MAPSLRSAGAAAAATAPASAPARNQAVTVLLSPTEVQRAVARLAREIARAHQNAGELVLMGIQTGGVHLARQLALQLVREWKGRVTVGQLDIAMHRDDLDRHLAPPVHPTDVPVDLADKVVVLVDDVLSTGRTVRAALDALHDLGRPRTVHLAVLVERPHRALPIRPDFVGKRVRTAPEDRVEVQLDGEDSLGAVLLIRGGKT